MLAATTVAGCNGGFLKPKPEQVVDPNAYPAHYESEIASYLGTVLTDRADFRGALIAQPAIKPVGESQRYVVCLQFNGNHERKDKVVVYLGGKITQFVDAKPEQCAGAAYQPFAELVAATPKQANPESPYDFSYKP
jgi:hypothetical protein